MKLPLLWMTALVWIILSPLPPSPLHTLSPVAHTRAAPQDEKTATIWQSDSTNTCSSLLQIASTGFASYLLCQQTRGQGVVPQAITQTLFQDLDAAPPLQTLSLAAPCLKSVSFGVTVYILYRDQISPDLDCVRSDIGKRLVFDVHMIQHALWERNDLWMNQPHPGNDMHTAHSPGYAPNHKRTDRMQTSSA